MCSDSATPADLAPPPRRVPVSLQAVCLLGGTKSCIWLWVFFGIGGLWCGLESLVAREMIVWSIFVLVVFGLVAALGIFVLAASLREGIRDRQPLIHGRFARGRVVASDSVGPKVLRLTFEVTADSGDPIEVRGTAYLDDFEEPKEYRRLLYDPSDPDSTLLLDNGGASHPPRPDGRGGLERPSIGDLCTAVGPPLLVLLVPIRGIVVILIGLTD